jgi:hypothetical protein
LIAISFGQFICFVEFLWLVAEKPQILDKKTIVAVSVPFVFWGYTRIRFQLLKTRWWWRVSQHQSKNLEMKGVFFSPLTAFRCWF